MLSLIFPCCEEKPAANATPVEPVGPEPTPPQDAPSQQAVSQMSHEEKTREKTRVQELVKHFASRAFGGIDCELVSDRGERMQGKYFIDRRLRKLTLKVTDGSPVKDTTVIITSIRNIWKPQESYSVFPPAVLATIASDEDKARLLAIELAAPEGSGDMMLETHFLLERTPEDRDNFLVCMNILYRYSQMNVQQSG